MGSSLVPVVAGPSNLPVGIPWGRSPCAVRRRFLWVSGLKRGVRGGTAFQPRDPEAQRGLCRSQAVPPMGFCRGKRYFETIMGFDGLCWLSVLGYVPAVGLEIPFAFIRVHLRFHALGRRSAVWEPRMNANERKYGAGGIGDVWEGNTLCAVSGGVPVLVRGTILGSSPSTRMTGEGRRRGSGKATRRCRGRNPGRCRRGDRGSRVSHAGGVTFPVPKVVGGPPSRTMTKKEGRGAPIGRLISQQVVSRRYARRRVRDHPMYNPAATITPAPTNVGASGSCPKIMNPTQTDPSSWKYWNGAMMLAGASAKARTTQ